jgi:hypothetical protein
MIQHIFLILEYQYDTINEPIRKMLSPETIIFDSTNIFDTSFFLYNATIRYNNQIVDTEMQFRDYRFDKYFLAQYLGTL